MRDAQQALARALCQAGLGPQEVAARTRQGHRGHARIGQAAAAQALALRGGHLPPHAGRHGGRVAGDGEGQRTGVSGAAAATGLGVVIGVRIAADGHVVDAGGWHRVGQRAVVAIVLGHGDAAGVEHAQIAVEVAVARVQAQHFAGGQRHAKEVDITIGEGAITDGQGHGGRLAGRHQQVLRSGQGVGNVLAGQRCCGALPNHRQSHRCCIGGNPRRGRDRRVVGGVVRTAHAQVVQPGQGRGVVQRVAGGADQLDAIGVEQTQAMRQATGQHVDVEAVAGPGQHTQQFDIAGIGGQGHLGLHAGVGLDQQITRSVQGVGGGRQRLQKMGQGQAARYRGIDPEHLPAQAGAHRQQQLGLRRGGQRCVL